jgi:exodeoxyribonuclease V alpha subunit
MHPISCPRSFSVPKFTDGLEVKPQAQPLPPDPIRHQDLAIAPVRLALTAKVLVITGGPGVDNTTTFNSISAHPGRQGSETSPLRTHRSRRQAHERSASMEARTIHRLLEIDPKTGGFRRGPDNPLDCDLLVIDETSMVDVLLMRAVLNAVPNQAALLIVGDVDQLPSVGPGQVLVRRARAMSDDAN